MFKPNKDNVLHRWAEILGPQRSVAHMLSHLGDSAIITRFAPGDEPIWLEALAVLMVYNPQFTIDEVMAALVERTEMPPMTARRKR